jgi:uncharacterized membrane protein YgcG
LFRSSILLALLLFTTACTASPGRLLLDDDAGVLDAAAIEAAAAALVARGATVAVYTTETGDATGAAFATLLAEDSLLRDGQIISDGIAVYVSFAPRYSELRVGSRWNADLPSDALEAIRAETLNPALRAGDATTGIAATLTAIEGRMGGGWGRYLLYVVGAAIAAFLSYAFLLDPLDNALRRLAATPAGRGVVRLWEATPAGAALARRRRIEDASRARFRLRRAAESAQTDTAIWFRGLDDALRDACVARFATLDAQATALAMQPDDAIGLAVELGALAKEYAAAADLARVCWQLSTRAQNAAERVAQIAHLPDDSPDEPPQQRKSKRQHKKERNQPGAIVARLAALDAERDTLVPQIASGDDVARRLADLTTRYNALNQLAYDVWKLRCPEEYAAEMRRIKLAQAEQERRAAAIGATGAASYDSYTAPAASSSSSDTWSSNSSSDSSPGESRAGGDW